eukprot:3191361-Rhodomonas_salina.4
MEYGATVCATEIRRVGHGATGAVVLRSGMVGALTLGSACPHLFNALGILLRCPYAMSGTDTRCPALT